MKVPEPHKLPSGSWRIQLRLNGVSISVTESTKAECVYQAQLIKAEHLSGKRKITQAQKMSLGDAIDAYIEERASVISPATLRGYRKIRENRFQTVIDKPIGSIDDWQHQIDLEAQKCASKTVRNAWGLIASVLKRNALNVPTVKLPALPKEEHAFLDPDQISTFIEAVHGQPCEIPALLGLHSLRRSEIIGLSWDDIDLESKMIHIRKTIVYDEHDHLVEKETGKTRSSLRDVPIFIPELLEALEAVEDKTGHVVNCSPCTIQRQVDRICEANNLPAIGAHGLRHSFASLAYNQGLSELQTMALGGWSDYNTMRKIYTHLDEKSKKTAAKTLENFFQNAHGNAHDDE